MGLQFEEKEHMHTKHAYPHIYSNKVWSIGGFFFRVHSGKVIISMDILVYGKCVHVIMFNKKNRNYYKVFAHA